MAHQVAVLHNGVVFLDDDYINTVITPDVKPTCMS